jgi:hypothetical protein
VGFKLAEGRVCGRAGFERIVEICGKVAEGKRFIVESEKLKVKTAEESERGDQSPAFRDRERWATREAARCEHIHQIL